MVIETEQAFRPLVIKLDTVEEAQELLDALDHSSIWNATERAIREGLIRVCS